MPCIHDVIGVAFPENENLLFMVQLLFTGNENPMLLEFSLIQNAGIYVGVIESVIVISRQRALYELHRIFYPHCSKMNLIMLGLISQFTKSSDHFFLCLASLSFLSVRWRTSSLSFSVCALLVSMILR